MSGDPDRRGRLVAPLVPTAVGDAEPPGRGLADRAIEASRVGIVGRLLGTIAIPLLVLVVGLSVVIQGRHDDAERAEGLAGRVDRLNELVDLRSALFAERVAAEVFLPDRRPPVAVLERSAFGRSLLADPDRLRSATDRALAAIPADDRPFDAAELAPLRRLGTGPDDVTPEVVEVLGDLDTRIGAAITTHLDLVRETAIELGDQRLIQAGTILQRVVAVPSRAGETVAALSDLWVAPPAARPAGQSAVARTLADLDSASGRFAESLLDPDGVVARLWAERSPRPATVRDQLADAVAGGLSGPERAVGQPITVGLALLDGIDWLIDVDRILPRAAEEVQDEAGRVATESRDTEHRTAALAVAALVVSGAAAWVFGRSIAQPVRQLTSQARLVGEGDLHLVPLELRGPPEVAVASRAVNDMVDNLVLLERKVNALADCDFDHPSLVQPLPGLLGASLERSVQVLSGSIEERDQLQLRLAYEASHDSLTGLCNRAALMEAVRRMLADRADGELAAIVFIDLNNFKRVNDRYGHAAGDELLRVVAARMEAVVAERGVVARLGGDEFVLALPTVRDRDDVVGLAQRLIEVVSEPVENAGRWMSVGVCAGVAIGGPDRAAEPDDVVGLLHRADLAIYRAKQSAEAVAVYDDDLDRHLAAEHELERALALTLAAAQPELRLLYQPIVDAASGLVTGAEALVRWIRPGTGPILPNAFIPVAEQSGLILELDRWVIRTALDQAASWADDPAVRDVSVSVNVSGRSLLDPRFVDHVARSLRRSTVPPARLTIEVTETVLVTDLELAAAQLDALRRLGVRIAIDDFGTGYTSIAHLRLLPVDEIKIDGSFVQGLHRSDNRALIEMINQLAHQLDVPTVAECVETLEQAEVLRAMGCDALQGYLFAPALAPDDLAAWVRRALAPAPTEPARPPAG